MNAYRIAPAGEKFGVVETYPDGEVVFIGGFHTEEDAEVWLDDFQRMLVRRDRAKDDLSQK